MRRPKFSIGSWAFSFGPFEKDPWSFEDFMQYAANAGYDGIEINGFHPHPHPDLYNTQGKCLELKKEIEGYGLGISGYAPDFREAPPARVERKVYLDAIEKMLKFCNYMQIQTLRIDTVSPPDCPGEAEYRQCFDRLARNWHEAADLCARYGVKLVWEFEPGFWLNKPSEIKAIVSAVGHHNFKVLFDTSHAYMCAVVGARQCGEKETLSEGVIGLGHDLKGQIGHFHLIDSDGSLHDDETSTHSPFGEGNIDFTAVIDALSEDIELLEWWCFDFCFCPTTEVDAKKAIPFVENIIQEVP
ncbi:MAG: sugar phosphate isomerase/epimerase family protein [Bacteroidota bacterium]